MSIPVNFRGRFPFGLTRRQIRDVGNLVLRVGIHDSIPHTVVNKSEDVDTFTLKGGVLKYAFRLSSVTVLVAWNDIKQSTRLSICSLHVQW